MCIHKSNIYNYIHTEHSNENKHQYIFDHIELILHGTISGNKKAHS